MKSVGVVVGNISGFIGEVVEFWSGWVVNIQCDVMIGVVVMVVGINMIFLLFYLMLV